MKNILVIILFVFIAKIVFAQKTDNINYEKIQSNINKQHELHKYRFRYDGDTINRLVLKVNPLLMFSKCEFGGELEYHFLKHFEIEAEGAYINGIRNVNGVSQGSGFALQVGFRFYFKSGVYINPTFFYRDITCKDRSLQWVNNGLDYTPILPDNFTSASTYEHQYTATVNERQQVYSFELLFGYEKLLSDLFLLDIYTGMGYRYKYQECDITSFRYNSIGPTNNFYPESKQIVSGYLPSIQLGIRLGFVFKLKKHSLSTGAHP